MGIFSRIRGFFSGPSTVICTGPETHTINRDQARFACRIASCPGVKTRGVLLPEQDKYPSYLFFAQKRGEPDCPLCGCHAILQVCPKCDHAISRISSFGPTTVTCTGSESHIINRDGVVFACRVPGCPGVKTRGVSLPEQGEYPSFLFSAKKRGEPDCPQCGYHADLQVCPLCNHAIQDPLEEDTIAVVGATYSGKTCFITSLIRELNDELSKEEMLGSSAFIKNAAGQLYFKRISKTIFEDRSLPNSTQKDLPISTLRMEVRFYARGEGVTSKQQKIVQLCFPDPAGELLQDTVNPYFSDFLQRSKAILLMVDPFAIPKYRRSVRLPNTDINYESLTDASIPLQKVIAALAFQEARKKRRPELAIVLTKCDAENLFDPDQEYDLLPAGGIARIEKHGIPFNPQLADRISVLVRENLIEKLGMLGFVTMAENYFKEKTRFFAASALGSPPYREGGEWRLENPTPRRVEEPLLWILHRWGYI
jgi:hypothetical protein